MTDAATTTPTITVTVQQSVPYDRISNLLCSAFEGGSNYWYTIAEFTAPPAFTFRTDPEHLYKHLDYPLNAGGALTIGDIEDDTNPTKILNLDTIAKGLQTMADKYPRHFGDFMSENDDADTGDVFLQCCLFDEIVYG
jgi:hypothetical protein